MDNRQPWTTRIRAIQDDEMKNNLAAILYYLIESSIKSPVTRKRTSPEESLWCEAHMILTHMKEEAKQRDANS